MEQQMSKVSFRISEVCRVTGLGRTSIYKAIADGRLRARKFQRATIVLTGDLEAFLKSLPQSVTLKEGETLPNNDVQTKAR
jgi:excisionase family DNA binding protein